MWRAASAAARCESTLWSSHRILRLEEMFDEHSSTRGKQFEVTSLQPQSGEMGLARGASPG